ncbi:FBP domain-containing protein [Actinoplanes subtropicus]|uniref:FBP domain-containing protein n=1 Tax=Actinoplanes subtropicus TaxID=543632 RepID=UPI0004C2CF0B|nr:FBP domain-containing protein [Actinoplanes subtropicus]
MEPLTEPEIRASFANCSRGEAGRIKVPELAAVPWGDLDFLGWTDPGAPQRALLVTSGHVGIVMRRPTARPGTAMRSSMCRICNTGHTSDGVTLFVAPLAGAAGRNGNTVGEYICSDLACSLYLRGKKQPRGRLVRQEETLTLDERVDRALTNLNGFVKRVTSGR